MQERWATEQVAALAPDAASMAAARTLAIASSWQDTGAVSGLLWGACAGSGKNPYQTAVDLDGPAFHCSCPSRKFPCKHALALLLLWAEGTVADAETAADFAQQWKAGRVTRAQRAAEPKGDQDKAKDEAAAAKRAGLRADRVAVGLAELQLWLRDQVRAGIGSSPPGYQHVEPVAARMIDAQAPAVANSLRDLGGISGTGAGWPGRLLSGYSRLHLLVRGHERLAEQPPDFAATIRTHVGYPTAKETVLASAGIADRWLVIGRRDVLDATIPARRTWLRGERTERFAVLLSFDPRGSFVSDEGAALVPGMTVDAELHFYPGRPPLRALLGARRAADDIDDARPVPSPSTVAQVLTEWARVLADDPWTAHWPAVLAGIPVVVDDRWLLAEDEATAVPLAVGGVDPWMLAAIAGGRRVIVAGEWRGTSLRPTTVWGDERAVPL